MGSPVGMLKRLLPAGVARRLRLRYRARANRAQAEAYRAALTAGAPGRRVLVVGDAGIGNAIELTPLVQALRAHWPTADLTFLAPWGDLFEGWCVVDRVAGSYAEAREWGPYGVSFVGPHSPIFLRSEEPTDWLGERRQTSWVNGLAYTKPEREYNLDMARAYGWTGEAPPLYVTMRRPGEAGALGIEGWPRVALAPGGKPDDFWRHKRWGGYGELVKRIGDVWPGARVAVVGTPADAVDEAVLGDERVTDLRGKLTPSQTAGLLRDMDVVVGNDCGPTHIADAVCAPVVVIFGPTCEVKNGPRNRAVVVRRPIECSPCQYDWDLMSRCPEARCMKGVSADDVIAAMRTALSLRPSRGAGGSDG